MGGLLRRFLVAITALAFLSGTVDRSALALIDPCPMTGTTHGMAHPVPEHPVGDIATKCFLCLGCLNLCPASPISNIMVQGKPIAFTVVLKTYTGRSIVLDPG